MISLAGYEFNKFSLSDTLLKISQMVRADFPKGNICQELDRLVQDATAYISVDLPSDLQLEQLLNLFFGVWGFKPADGIFRMSDALWLDKVLQTRRGSSLSLGILLLHVAKQLELPLEPVFFPTQLILRADWLDEELWLINPENGETLNEHTLNMWIKGHLGYQDKLTDNDLDEANNEVTIRRYLYQLKVALMQEEEFELALAICEILISLDPADPYEIRDRGLIFIQLGCMHVALPDLNYFVQQCPNDPIVEMVKVHINTIGQNNVILH